MKLPAPRTGSFLWLLAHDLRLSWRRFHGMFGKLRPRTILLIVASAVLSFHALAWPLSRMFTGANMDVGDGRLFYPALASGVLFVLPWLISQSLTGATRALYSRGDLDLLLASPLPAHHILGARAIAIAVEAVASVSIFILPLANMLAFNGGSHWLALYPALAAGGLFAAALGILIALGLFKLVGPRRTRVLSQVLATIVGASFVLGLQVLNVLSVETREAVVAAIDRSDPGTIFDRNGALWLPVRAAAGDVHALMIWIVVSLALFIATVLFTGRLFASSVLMSAGEPSVTSSRAPRNRTIRFRQSRAHALRTKEWRLVARDPWLISQILLQVIYTLPVSIIVWRALGTQSAIAVSVAPAIVVIASQISASLAWLTISSEDAPDFLASAPVTRAEVERRKLEAIALPLALFLALPLIGLAVVSFTAALWTVLFATCAALSTALLNLWHPMPGRRTMVMRRHSQSKIVGMIEHLLSLLWAVAMVLTVLGSIVAALPIVLALAVLWFNRPAASLATSTA
jgi:ABC-2 type transport system permease protein